MRSLFFFVFNQLTGLLTKAQPYIGGQAVIEGVMMRSPTAYCVAVRKPNGTLAVLSEFILREDHWMFKVPGLRGVVMLVESMKLGFKSLQFSADQQMTEEEKNAAGESPAWIGMVIALVIFMALPQGIASTVNKVFGLQLNVTDVGFHVLTGAGKLLMFTLYLLFIRRIPEIRRVFQYHGAEHKTIYAYESGKPLDVAHVKLESTLHPRCGTTFLILVIFVSIVVGASLTPLLLPWVGVNANTEGAWPWLATLLLRISILPLIAAISYEFQRFSAKHCSTGPLRVLLLPGFIFQKITTQEPDASQLEVALTAMRSAIAMEQMEYKKGFSEVKAFANFALAHQALPTA